MGDNILRTLYNHCDITGILSRTVSELSQLIIQILDTLRFLASLKGGGKDNVRCSFWAHWKALGGLPMVIERFSLCVTAAGAILVINTNCTV